MRNRKEWIRIPAQQCTYWVALAKNYVHLGWYRVG